MRSKSIWFGAFEYLSPDAQSAAAVIEGAATMGLPSAAAATETATRALSLSAAMPARMWRKNANVYTRFFRSPAPLLLLLDVALLTVASSSSTAARAATEA